MKTALDTKQLKRMRSVLDLAGVDFSYCMEGPANAMLCAGMTAKSALPSLRSAVERSLWLTATDLAAALGANLPDEFKDCKGPLRTLVLRTADRAAQNLLRNVEVTDPDAVPPVAARRGFPAAMAASAGL
jgi:hypothetical protein